MNDVVARGMTDPNDWQRLVSDPTPIPPIPGIPGADITPRNFFGRSVGRAIGTDPDQTPLHLAKLYGSAFVIDPMAISVIALPSGSPFVGGINKRAAPFPADASNYYIGRSTTYYAVQHWQTWRDDTSATIRPELWPIRRVTFHQPLSAAASKRWDPPVAASLFSTTDDLAYDLPSQSDRPAVQLWETAAAGPLERQSVGEYSWIVTVAPTSSEAQVALGRNPHSHAYDVSVVVFYKRPIAPTLSDPDAASRDLYSMEATVGGSVLSKGPSGGELLLRLLGSYSSDSPLGKLRAGQWLMICGPHPASSDASPRFVMNWYQVLAVDAEGTGVTSFDPTMNRVVALRGPEWPWDPRQNHQDPNSEVAKLSDDLCVGIFPSAVAVHTKTLRLPSN
jgi:hypothetical protein